MKILMVNDNDPDEVVGGCERYIADATRELEAIGHEVHWFTIRDTARGVPADRRHATGHRTGTHERHRAFAVSPARWLRWFMRHVAVYPALWRALRGHIAAVRPDVVHLHNNYRYPLTILTASRGSRVVQTVHDYCLVQPTAYCTHAESCAGRSVFAALNHGCMNWKLLLTEGWLLYGRAFLDPLFVGRFIAPSQNLATCLRRCLGSADVRMLGNFRSLVAVPECPLSESRAMLYAGGLIAHKGVDVLIAAYAALADEFADAELWIAGDGPDRAELEAAAADVPRVRFFGQLGEQELADRYRRARLVVIPSLGLESSGLVAIEAMAHGRPVVATSVGGLAELVDDGQTGLIFGRGDVADLTTKLRLLLNDGETAQRLGTAGRAKYAETATPDRHIDRLVALYEELV